MKYSLLLILFFANILSAQSTFFIKYNNTTPQDYIIEKTIPGKLIDTRLFKAAALDYKTSLFAKGLAKDDEVLGRIIKVDFASPVNESELQDLLNDPQIEYIQKSILYKVDFIPNDSLLAEQWALKKINAFDAWNITQGSDTILLAIIDTGIDYLHPDLKNKIKHNDGETGTDNFTADKRTNGIDDDGNGFIDDYMGWDFTDRLGFPFDSTGGDYLNWDNNPADEYGHGTLIAGVSSAETNNFTGVAGTAPGIKILNVRAFDPSGYGEEDDAAAAILYAVKMGAKVINMSFGDNSFSYVLRDVIKYAYAKNVVLVASSGNSGSEIPHYPSGYSEVISVGNSTENDYISSTSNYGSTLDMVAPGSLILTTAMNSSYSTVSGTSLAAPFVSAAAALLLSQTNYTNDEIRQILKSTSDDISPAGWDQRSGSGRLNLYKALSITAPSIIKFDYPKQDFATLQDTLNIIATVLSAYFTKYEIYLGNGNNPSQWNLLNSGEYQFSSQKISNLLIKDLPDSVYTLRLVVYQSNGRTTEERVNFHISRKPPAAELVTIGPALYGTESTILASVYTEVPCIAKMYFRKAQSSDEFNFITLDGFATNNQFVKYLHYGFIPEALIIPETLYEIYLEAENLTGLKTTIKDSVSNFFYKTSFNAEYGAEYEMPFRLPFGQLYEESVNITGNNRDVLFNGFFPGLDLFYGIYSFDGEKFTKVDSIKNKIPRDIGDFNSNGKTDILSTAARDAYIDEQDNPGSSHFGNFLTDTTGYLWSSFIKNIDEDSNLELAAFSTDTSIIIQDLASDFSKQNSLILQNFSQKGIAGNTFGYPRIINADLDSDGKQEIWTVDNDGDVISFEFDNGSFLPSLSFETGLAGSSEYITSGDFNGDNKEDIAVLLRSIQDYQIAPFNYLIVFTQNGVLFAQAFVDPSAEFNTNFNTSWNSIKFVDIDNDNKDELVTFTFPYSYIFKYDNNDVKIISYKENINSRTVFSGDLNKNGVTEIAFPMPDGIRFIEFKTSDVASAPFNLEGYSLDSSRNKLSWFGKGERYLIYRGLTKTALSLYDSVNVSSYEDLNVENKKSYYYSVQSFDSKKISSYSNPSNIIEVYTHNTSQVNRVESSSRNTVQVYFTEKINTTILDLQSFLIQDFYNPVSISPATEYSYLLSFNANLLMGENVLLIRNLKDMYGSPVKEDSIKFMIDSVFIGDQFYVTSHAILSPYLIKVVFNLDVDDNSALNRMNYSFEPDNSIESIQADENNSKIIYIYLQKKRPIGAIGIESKLTIKDVYSSIGSGFIKINSGAGSIMVLNAYASDLSAIYTYPNPVRIGNENVMFAGLPKKASISIFSLNGDQLRTLEENDGNGGVEFDLTDNDGRKLSSGIYIYRVVRLDDLNNEVEEKLGKFAVIK